MTSKEEESPLKPIPFNEFLRMLSIRHPNKGEELNESESSAVENALETDILGNISTDNSLSAQEDNEVKEMNETDCNPSIGYRDFLKHDLSPMNNNINVYSNDSGYSSTTNRTNCSASMNRMSFSLSRLSMVNVSESFAAFNEVSSRKHQEFVTPAQKPHASILSAVKTTNSSRFESFVAPNKMDPPKKGLFNNHMPSTANNIENEKFLFQCTPSSKLINMNSKLIRKPLFIPSVVNPNNSQPIDNKNDGIPNTLGDISVTTSDLFNSGCHEFIKVKQSKYIKGNLIGRGGSCEVYHCFDPVQKVSRAIKVVNLKQNGDTAVFYRNEVKLLQNLQHSARIIKLYDYEIVDSEGYLYMVLEMGGKDLDKILKQLSANSSNLPFYKILFYWMEMLHCVSDMQNKGIVHSDLKPANFLMAESGIKLIDFGIASHLHTDMTSAVRNSAIGSLNYISPEALKCDEVTSKYKIKFKSDIWSLGCILYQLVYKKGPFQHITNMCGKIAAITNKDHKIEYPPASWIPPRILGTIRRCLQYNPNLRPGIDELIAEYETCNFQ